MANIKFVTALKRGLDVLESFTMAEPRLTLRQITGKTGLPKATVYRLLQTLISLNYVDFDSHEKVYFPAPRVLSLGYVVISGIGFREVANPYLKELAGLTDQNVNLGILDGTEVVYIDRIRKRVILHFDLHIGSRLSAWKSSIGRAILAYLGEEEFENVMKELLKDVDNSKSLGSDGACLVEKLERVRQIGYAVNDEELVKGLRAVSAPVFNGHGNVVGAINLAAFSLMCSSRELVDKFVPLLKKTACTISETQGFMGTYPG